MAKPKGRRALGRGLDALLPPRSSPPSAPERAAAVPPADRDAVVATPLGRATVFTCAIERITPRGDQPRQHFDDEALDALAGTIATHGIIQPLVVRRIGPPGREERFEIIAGERRWRAAQRAGLRDVPVVVKDVAPREAFELALIENLARLDLNPIEVAEAYRRLLEDLGHTQEALAERVGKSRVAVTNALRLLKLPAPVRALLADGSLSEGHGRALLGAEDDDRKIALARRAARDRLSVRKLERLARQAPSSGADDGRPPSKTPPPETKSAAVRDLETRLSRRFGARATVEPTAGSHGRGGGKLVVRYADLDELDRIIERLGM
ncbi:MAG: ParB/RepB/Spo0J family partition protein [Myxococcota bacterium]